MPSAFVNAGRKDDVSKEKYESKGASAGGDGDQRMAESGYTIILYSCVELTISIVHGTRRIPVLHFIHMLFTILHQICLICVRS